MSLEIGSFVVWSVWADQYWHLCFSWTWWQGGELEHQWRLRVLSQRNCCGVVDVGLLEVVVHSWSRRFIICGVVALCAAEREMRPLCIILQHCAIRRRREDWADTPSHKSFYISPHIKMYLYCLSLPICHIPLDTLQYFFFIFFLLLFPRLLFFHTTAWPNYVLNQTPHVDYEWEMLNDKLSSLGTASWKLSHIVLERVG